MQKPNKQLLAEWNKKLKDSGFEDVEQDNGNLKQWHSVYFLARYKPVQFMLKETYYQMAGSFLNDHPFEDSILGRIDKYIWQRHSEGGTSRKIAEELKSLNIKTNYNKVNKVIKALSDKMVEKYK